MLAVENRAVAVRKGIWLEYVTLLWNSAEALVALASGFMAGSIALLGFGFDSVVECSSGAVLLWRLRSDANVSSRERIELRAVRLVGISFLILAAYVAWESIEALYSKEAAHRSWVGIGVAALSLVVMPILAHAKRKVARSLSSDALQADSRQTDICAYLSAILLAGLVLNATLGWWWADPVAALVMVPIIAKEGINGLSGKGCGCHAVQGSQKSCSFDGDDCCHPSNQS